MELIESYGLTLADINNLVRHAISAADNVHPHNLVNQVGGMSGQEFGGGLGSRGTSPVIMKQRKNGGPGSQGQKADDNLAAGFGQQKGQFERERSGFEFGPSHQNIFNSRATFDREVKVGASVLTEKGNIYQGSNFEQPISLFNSMSTGGLGGAPSSFLNSGSPWASAGAGGIGDDRVFIQAEDCAIMKAMIDGNTQIRAIAVHVKHLIPSLNQQCQAVQAMYGFPPPSASTNFPPFGATPGQFGGYPPNMNHNFSELGSEHQFVQQSDNLSKMNAQQFELTPKSMHDESAKHQRQQKHRGEHVPFELIDKQDLNDAEQGKELLKAKLKYKQLNQSQEHSGQKGKSLLFESIEHQEPFLKQKTLDDKSEGETFADKSRRLQSTRNLNQPNKQRLEQMLEQGFQAFEEEQMNENAIENREKELDNFVFDQEGDPESNMLNKNDTKKEMVQNTANEEQLKRGSKSFKIPNFDQLKNIDQSYNRSQLKSKESQDQLPGKRNTLYQPEMFHLGDGKVRKKFSPRLKQHILRQRTEQALLASANLPNYMPIMQIPIGKWRNNMLFNRITSQIQDHQQQQQAFIQQQNWQNQSAGNFTSQSQQYWDLHSPKYPPAHHFLMILCQSETSYVLKTSASIMSQNQIQNMFTNSFISPSLNVGQPNFSVLPGQPLTTPRGSLNIANTRLNLTGYRRESERLNFPIASQIHSILDSAIFWTQIDHNQETRREIESLLIQDNFRELTKRFKRRLKLNIPNQYADRKWQMNQNVLKCKIGAGFSKINPITLQQFAHGIVDFMLNYQPRENQEQEFFLKQANANGGFGAPQFHQTQIQELLANKGIVLGYDQKTQSCTIAKLLAAVFKKYGGVQIHWIDKVTTQSFLAYYTKTFGCMLGIMVSCEQIQQHASSSQSCSNPSQFGQGSQMNGQMMMGGGGASMVGPQSSQFNQEALDYVKIQLNDAWGRPLHPSLLGEIRHQMNEFILNNLTTPDISSVYDFSAQKLKFVASNFTDITIRKYINSLEKSFLIDKAQNANCPKCFIAFSCFQGPVSFFIKKVMANFDFKSPFNMLDTPCMSLSTQMLSGVFGGGSAAFMQSQGGAAPSSPSEYLLSNGASQNLFSPLFCPRERLHSMIHLAEAKNSKLIIQTDPQGHQFVLHEAILEDMQIIWRQVSFEEIIIIVLETAKSKNHQNWLQDQVIKINKSIYLPVLHEFCKNNGIKIKDCDERGPSFLQIEYEQNKLKIEDAQYDSVSVCVIIAQAFKEQTSFLQQIKKLGNKWIDAFQTYPVTIQNKHMRWPNIFEHITLNPHQAFQKLIYMQNQARQNALPFDDLPRKCISFQIGDKQQFWRMSKQQQKSCQILKVSACTQTMIQFSIRLVDGQAFLPLVVDLIQISKYDAIFQVKRIIDQADIAEDPCGFKNIDIPTMLHALIQIAFDEQPYSIISIGPEDDANNQNAPSFCQSHVQVSVSDIRRENSDSKETSKDTRLSIGAKPVKLTFNRTDQESRTAEHQKEGSPIIEDTRKENPDKKDEPLVQETQLSQEKPMHMQVKLTHQDGNVFERPLSKRRRVEKKESIGMQRPGSEAPNAAVVNNLETSSSTVAKNQTSQLFQMPLKSPMRVPNQPQSNPNFGYNTIGVPPQVWQNIQFHQNQWAGQKFEPAYMNCHPPQEMLAHPRALKISPSLESHENRSIEPGPVHFQPAQRPGFLRPGEAAPDSARMQGHPPPQHSMSLPHQDWLNPVSTPSPGPASHAQSFWPPPPISHQSISPDGAHFPFAPYALQARQMSPLSSTFHLKHKFNQMRMPYLVFL